MCAVTKDPENQNVTTAWVVNDMGPYRRSALRNGILAGYTTTLDSNNLIVENIMMNDDRNGSEYYCVIIPVQSMILTADIIDESDPAILHVAGEYQYNYIMHIIICIVFCMGGLIKGFNSVICHKVSGSSYSTVVG